MASAPATKTLPLLAQTGGAATRHWNLLIAAASRRHPLSSLSLYKSMQSSLIPPNNHTFPSLLQSLSSLQNPILSLHLHAHLLRLGLLLPHTTSALIHGYGNCKLPDHALKLFDEIPQRERDPILCTSLISSLSRNGRTPDAFRAFALMRSSGNVAGEDAAAAAAALASAVCKLRHGEVLHALAIKERLEIANLRLGNTFISMYAKFGGAASAAAYFREIPASFRDVVSWNTVISGLAVGGEESNAIDMFEEMLAAGELPNRVTVVSVLKAAAQLGSGAVAGKLHGYVFSCRRPPADDVVVMTALMDLQARCGELEKAREIFNAIEGKNVVCWSAMIAAYEQNSIPEEALSLFKMMMEEREIKPNVITLLSVVSAASNVGAANAAAAIHKLVISAGAGDDDRIFSGMIDMYAKCGDLHLARKLFSERERSKISVSSWTAMIGAEGMHGCGREALSIFAEMQKNGCKPNEITFIAVLSACSHGGLVEEGVSCFREMDQEHGISPNQKHYSCVVDLLGRSGKLKEALDLVEKMPIEADLPIWGSLLGACRIHGNTRIAEIVEKRIQTLPDPWRSAGHMILLANLYNRGGRKDDASRVRTALRSSRTRKIVGRSFVTLWKTVYAFTAEDRSHEESDLIYEELRELDHKIRVSGYAKNAKWNLEDGEFHSERLAMAFWMMMMRRRKDGEEAGKMRIMKNLRVCEDCHEYTKAVSKVIGLELVVRDSRRFHHFKDGICSCRRFLVKKTEEEAGRGGFI